MEFDDEPICIDGVGEEPSASRYCCFLGLSPPSGAEVVKGGSVDWVSSSFRRQWCWEAIFLSITSAAGGGRQTSKVKSWPILKPAKGSGAYLTSSVRPLLKSVAALNVRTEASGSVPASVLDGGDGDFRLGGGEREGFDCFFPSFSEVFSTNTRDLCVICFSYEVLCKICTSTACY